MSALEIAELCEALPPEKREEVADFDRFLLARQHDARWEATLAEPKTRPRLDAFVRESASEPTHLCCEYRENPLGIDVAKPRLSWQIEDRGQRSEDRGQKQRAYQVLVASTPDLLAKDQGDLWDSGKVVTDQSNQVAYAGKALESRALCHWKVRVWINDDKATEWSQVACWSMGLLAPTDWQAKWIGLDLADASADPRDAEKRRVPARYLRREFAVEKKVKRAMAYVCGLGCFDLHINGKKVGDHVMDPVLTEYTKRACYVAFDVTQNVGMGHNVAGVILGNGRFFAPRLTNPAPYKDYRFKAHTQN